MKNFIFYAPTKVVFGKNTESQVGALVREFGGNKVLVHFGGKSARASGLLHSVEESLKSAGIEFVELGGVVPNPLLSKVLEGADLCRRENVDFMEPEEEAEPARELSEIEKIISDTEIDTLSPIQALMFLADLKNKIKEKSNG